MLAAFIGAVYPSFIWTTGGILTETLAALLLVLYVYVQLLAYRTRRKLPPATNSGNYGVLCKIVLEHVAPHSLLTFNPRGGLFRGSALVNGSVVTFSHLGAAAATDPNSVLYRTGASEESVEIWISPTAGSNLLFCLQLSPLPSVRN
ncbi:hypothetical protein [Paenibacillus sp. D51F]